MTDNNDDTNGARPPRGPSDRPRSTAARPRPKPPASGDRPFRAGKAPGGDERPFRKRDAGERSFGPRRDDRRPGEGPRGSDRPSRPRNDDRAPPRPREEPVEAAPEEPVEERIAKVIARAGVASRRDAEVMIAEGRVTLNGEVLASPAINVTRADVITVDGETLPAKERTRLWIYHKPRGQVTTARDPEGRPTVFENLPEELPRVVAIGRLDMNTEGLLLLTNDGGLARTIAHPQTGWLRRYKVRAHGEVTQADLDRLRDGVTVDEMDYGPVEANLDRVQGDNAWITLGLREGKNREVKRILEHLGLQVNRLIRLSFGPFQLGELEPGLVEEVRTKVLKEQLGQKLAEEAGVDFTSPVREPIAPFGSPKRAQPAQAGARAQSERPEHARPRQDRDDRPRREDRERPFRARPERSGPPSRDARDRPERRDAAPAARPERRRAVWRAGETDEPKPHSGKIPRRGQDPREARAAAAERPRERVGAIAAPEGRNVVVERLVREPSGQRERPKPRPFRPEGPRGSFAGGNDRPPRRDDRGSNDRPPRKPREGFGRGAPDRADARPARFEGDRSPRNQLSRGRGDDERPRRPTPDGRPARSGPPEGGPGRGGPSGRGGGGFRAEGPRGPRGDFGKGPGRPGPRKGPPRDRRP